MLNDSGERMAAKKPKLAFSIDQLLIDKEATKSANNDPGDFI